MNLGMQAQTTEGDGAQHPEHPLKKTQVTFPFQRKADQDTDLRL